MLFEKNMGTHLSIDETALSNDELYAIVTNKSAKGQKGAIVAMIRGYNG
jgi:transposase